MRAHNLNPSMTIRFSPCACVLSLLMAILFLAMATGRIASAQGAPGDSVPTLDSPTDAYRLTYRHWLSGRLLRSDGDADFSQYVRMADGEIEVLQGHAGDTLRIATINRQAPAPPAIYSVNAPAGLRALDSQGPIDVVESGGPIWRMTIRGPVGLIDVGEARAIRILAAQREPAWTTIQLGSAAVHPGLSQIVPTSIQLSGIGLDLLHAPRTPFRQVVSASRMAEDGAGRYVSPGGIGRSGRWIEAQHIQRLQASGGSIVLDRMTMHAAVQDGVIRASAMAANLGRPPLGGPIQWATMRGDIHIDQFEAPGADQASIVAVGGNIIAGQYRVGRRIHTFGARRQRLGGEWMGGYVGAPERPYNDLIVAAGSSGGPTHAGIQLVYGTEGVRGRFYAGALLDADNTVTTPTYAGVVERIDVRRQPTVRLFGEAFMSSEYPASQVFRPIIRPQVWENNEMLILQSTPPPRPTPAPRPTPPPATPDPTPPAARFVDNEDGTITDTMTGLMWVQAPHDLPGNSGVMRWNDAQTYVGNLNFAGHTDWRLPHVDQADGVTGPVRPAELNAVGRGEGDPQRSWNTSRLKAVFKGLKETHYWSGTTYEVGTSHAWRVDLDNGKLYVGNKAYGNYLWPVRDGQ